MINQSLVVGVRAWTEVLSSSDKSKNNYSYVKGWRSQSIGKRVLVFDTETTADRLQNLQFGCFRLYEENRLLLEGLILSDTLTEIETSKIKAYANTNKIPVASRQEFIEKVFLPEVYELGTLCVGFNLPFDLSRIAQRAGVGRKKHKNSFTFFLTENPYNPRLRVESINNKASFISLASPKTVPERKGGKRKLFKGNFLDLRTLVWALTNQSHSLKSACNLFQVDHGKQEVETYGVITNEFIDYCRRDVLATWELYVKLTEEYNKHPIELPITKVYSPASIGKAYMKAIGIQPLHDKQPDSPSDVLGYAMASYYGGRAECHVRKTVVPITYLDVISMYPTVFVLQGLWKYVIAKRFKVEDATELVKDSLSQIILDDLFQKETWLNIPALVEVKPDSDIFPIRAKYADQGDFQIGLNHLTSKESMWYTLADVIAAKLLTGKMPQVIRAIRVIPEGIQTNLKPVSLSGSVPVDPTTEDFFKKVIEERKHVQKLCKDTQDPVVAKKLDALQKFLKVIANSTSYGIFAEFNRKDFESEKKQEIIVRGQSSYITNSVYYEEPGYFANPVIATLITGAARLILAMVELSSIKEGTTYAFCDTDSMAVVGRDFAVAERITKRFESICPYHFGGSILKVEDENFDEESKERSQLYFYGISAKRYALFNLDKNGNPIIRKYSEHGLGHLLSPSQDDSTCWMEELWLYLISNHLGNKPKVPEWLVQPSVSRLSVTRPVLWKPFRTQGTDYKEQVKPFNFMLVGFGSIGSYQEGNCKKQNAERIGCPEPKMPCKYRSTCRLTQPIRPVAPYEREAKKWPGLAWTDLKTGIPIQLNFTQDSLPMVSSIPVQTYRSVLQEYVTHPEAKAAGPDGVPCSERTVGILQRMNINAVDIIHIGKESNRLEEVQTLGINDKTYVIYEEDWTVTKEKLKAFPIMQIARISGLSRREVQYLLSGVKKPHLQTVKLLQETLELLRMNTKQNSN